MATWPPAGVSGAKATFAGGCFWGLELALQRVPGVKATAVGYIAGTTDQPTYEAVCTGRTGHAEAVQVLYDESEVSFTKLMDTFFTKHDPTTLNRQGGDVGTQYRSGIYTHSESQLEEAKARVASIPGATTEVLAAGTFWPAEEYHQQYLEQGGRFGRKQSAKKGCTDPIRCLRVAGIPRIVCSSANIGGLRPHRAAAVVTSTMMRMRNCNYDDDEGDVEMQIYRGKNGVDSSSTCAITAPPQQSTRSIILSIPYPRSPTVTFSVRTRLHLQFLLNSTRAAS